MAFCRLVLPLVVSAICLLQSVYGADEPVSVPVFLWGDVHKSSAKYNPLSHLTGDKFEDLVKQETIDDPFVVVFIDQTLSVEDFSQKNADGKSSFPYLQQNIGKSIYIPSVESPVSVLSEIPDAEKVDRIDLNGDGLSAVIKPQSGKYLLINLKDAKEGESRTELLRRHNDFIEDLFPKLKDHYKKIIGIYTAHNAAWTVLESHNRVRRQAETAALAAYHYLDIEGLLLYANKINIHDGNNTIALPTTTPTATKTSNETDGTMDIKLNYSDTSLVLNFFSKGGYWFLNSIDLTLNGITETLSIQQELYAAEGFAYRCGNNVTYSSSNDTRPYSVEFQDLKVQPFFTGNGTAQGFGDSFNCVGFFSVPIWSCLFVVFILLSITFYGIMMMMDIRTMDRFDDPKGKTITINAGE